MRVAVNGSKYFELHQACFGVVETVLDADRESRRVVIKQ